MKCRGSKMHGLVANKIIIYEINKLAHVDISKYFRHNTRFLYVLYLLLQQLAASNLKMSSTKGNRNSHTARFPILPTANIIVRERSASSQKDVPPKFRSSTTNDMSARLEVRGFDVFGDALAWTDDELRGLATLDVQCGVAIPAEPQHLEYLILPS
jgi:hypothetical protein